MSARPQQPEPFVRGCIYPALSDTAYPRANPSDSEHLPTDVWQAAQVPAGVRLEFVGEVDAVRIFYKTTTANLGYRGEGAGCTFSLYRSGQKLAEQEAVLGEGVVQLPLYGEPSRPAIVYLPEGMRPIITGIEGIGGYIEPAPRQPRWLCYGDAVTQGWLASAPSLAWPAVTARKLGLDLFNLGYAGSARSDTAAALRLAGVPAEIVSLSIGANSWGRFPATPAMCAEEIRAVLTLLRAGHPDAPIVIVSPLLRPDAEDTPNPLGATLTELRIAMEEAVRERMISGDVRLHLVEGSTVVSASDLADSRYPGDDGHIRIAAAVGKVISPLVGDLRAGAEAHWAAEVAAVLQLESPVPQLPSTDFLRQVGTAIGPVTSAPAAPVVPGYPPAPVAPGYLPAPVAPGYSQAPVAPGYTQAPAPPVAPSQPHGPIPSVAVPPVGVPPVGVPPVGVPPVGVTEQYGMPPGVVPTQPDAAAVANAAAHAQAVAQAQAQAQAALLVAAQAQANADAAAQAQVQAAAQAHAAAQAQAHAVAQAEALAQAEAQQTTQTAQGGPQSSPRPQMPPLPDREQSGSAEQTMVEFATQSVASAESQYRLQAQSAGDDANWADELAGAQLVADVELSGAQPPGPDPAGPDPDPAGAEFASMLRDSRYDTAS